METRLDGLSQVATTHQTQIQKTGVKIHLKILIKQADNASSIIYLVYR